MTSRPLLVLALLILTATVVAPTFASDPETGIPSPPPNWRLSGDAERGAEIFADKCALCHGKDGSGRRFMPLDPKPRDLTDPEELKLDSDWQLYLVIRDGGEAVGLADTMIGVGDQVTAQEVHDVAVFVKGLSETESAGD
jgi:mono/diheme cytochrome c family protein